MKRHQGHNGEPSVKESHTDKVEITPGTHVRGRSRTLPAAVPRTHVPVRRLELGIAPRNGPVFSGTYHPEAYPAATATYVWSLHGLMARAKEDVRIGSPNGAEDSDRMGLT